MGSEKCFSYVNNDNGKIYITENEIMFRESGLTVGDILQMVVAFTLRFWLPIKAKQSLVEMLKTFSGPQIKNLQLTNHHIIEILNVPANVMF